MLTLWRTYVCMLAVAVIAATGCDGVEVKPVEIARPA
jgi:hypothetical protein